VKKNLFIFLLFLVSFEALADHPVPWQINFQEAVTPVMAEIERMHNELLYLCYAVSALVFFLLVYIVIRFNEKANPVPSKTAHNVALEVVWTLIPLGIIIALMFPTIKILHHAAIIPEADMTLKVIGRQWYWQYEYADQNIAFDSMIIQDQDIKEGQIRLLEVDNRVVVPVDTTVRVLVTAGDVVHSWAMPAFGIKTDAVPGRINETWFKVSKPGIYHGQCSELCGVNHGFMPIVVEVVSKEEYQNWLKEAKQKFAFNSHSNNLLAMNNF